MRRRALIKKLTVASEGDKNVNLFLELRETFVTLGTEFLGITATDVTVADPGRPRGPRPPSPDHVKISHKKDGRRRPATGQLLFSAVQ